MNEILRRLELCIQGHCYNCPYFYTKCTDDLIDDVYKFLKGELKFDECNK